MQNDFFLSLECVRKVFAKISPLKFNFAASLKDGSNVALQINLSIASKNYFQPFHCFEKLLSIAESFFSFVQVLFD
jgi:hypothetical protein